MKMESHMLKIWLAAFVVIALSSTAYAGCIGAGVGDGCIGIPTPGHRHDYDESRHRGGPVIVDHHHHHPVIIERHDEDEDE